MADERRVLITGADGYLGRRIAGKFLERDGASLLLWVRARDAAEFEAKKKALAADFTRRGRLAEDRDPLARIAYAWGDLTAESPFASVDPGSVRSIVHTAAVTRFNVEEEIAREVNVLGTEKLLRFASRCEGLESFGLLSTIYASGLRPGRVLEVRLDEGRFANHYESSKWQAEDMLLEAHSSLPWRILRIATVIADGEDGTVSQHNAVHNTLQLLYYGLISTVPGLAETPVYLVTGDLAAEAVHRLMDPSHARRIFHVAHRREQSLTLGRILDIVFEVFGSEESFRKRRIARPLYVDEQAFDLLHKAVASFSGGVVSQAVDSVAPFAAQLYVTKEVHNENLIAALGADPAPDPVSLLRNTCAHLIRTRWGRGAEGARDVDPTGGGR